MKRYQIIDTLSIKLTFKIILQYSCKSTFKNDTKCTNIRVFISMHDREKVNEIVLL